jgi:anti-sigma factor RsiW
MKMDSHSRDLQCQEVAALLSEYLDLELPPEACREIEAHVAGCSPCTEFAESLRKTVDLCRRYRPSELPERVGADAREQLLKAYGRMLETRGNNQRSD